MAKRPAATQPKPTPAPGNGRTPSVPPAPLRDGESTAARLFGSCALAIQPASPVPEGEADTGLRPFKGLLYTGNAVRTWFGLFVIDLARLKLPAEGQRIPALYGHFGPVGYLTAARMTAAGLEVEGNLITRGDSAAAMKAREIAELADAGFPWQMSAGIDMTVRLVDAGASVTVNGATHEGPVWVASQSRLREGSFVELGADPDTNTAVLRIAEGIHDMPDPAQLEMVDSDSITADWLKENKPEIVAAIKAEEVDQSSAADDAAAPVPDAGATMAAATVAELEALPGAGAEFIVAQLKAGATLVAAQSDLMARLAAEKNELTARLNAALKATAADPIPGGSGGSGGSGVARFEGARGEDPAQDWAGSPALRAHWTGRTATGTDEALARRAFIKFAEKQQESGESWLDA